MTETLGIFAQSSLKPIALARVVATRNFEMRGRTSTLLLERATVRNVTPGFGISRRELRLYWAGHPCHSAFK